MPEKTSQHRSSVWQADAVSIVLLVVFVLVVFGLESLLDPTFTNTTLLLTGVILAVVPAAIWIAFFYRRDRLEPEPKSMVFQVFLLGGLLAAAVGIPLVDNVFQVSEWLYDTFWTQLLGGILVIGFTQEFLKYAAVRWSVYKSEEFDEPVDGIIYATAAGLGYATVLNVAFVVGSGGVDLGTGVIRITVTALAHASFAGVVGYFLGREKFGAPPVWNTALGVTLAAVLNGVFFYLRNTLTQGGLSAAGGEAQRWLGFALAAVLAAVVTALLATAISRQLATQGESQ